MDLEKHTILVVEDDKDLRDLLADKLSDLYNVLTAGDGEEAVNKIVDNRPVLVLLDLLLPKLDGFKVLERIRKYPDQKISGTHVVVLSNLWSQKDILQIQGLKVDEYFVKAHTKVEEVIARVRVILAPVAKTEKTA